MYKCEAANCYCQDNLSLRAEFSARARAAKPGVTSRQAKLVGEGGGLLAARAVPPKRTCFGQREKMRCDGLTSHPREAVLLFMIPELEYSADRPGVRHKDNN